MILRGSVDIYIDPTLSGEDGTNAASIIADLPKIKANLTTSYLDAKLLDLVNQPTEPATVRPPQPKSATVRPAPPKSAGSTKSNKSNKSSINNNNNNESAAKKPKYTFKRERDFYGKHIGKQSEILFCMTQKHL